MKIIIIKYMGRHKNKKKINADHFKNEKCIITNEDYDKCTLVQIIPHIKIDYSDIDNFLLLRKDFANLFYDDLLKIYPNGTITPIIQQYTKARLTERQSINLTKRYNHYIHFS